MKKITIKSLTLDNFKGSNKITLPFADNITKLIAPNGQGKTRVFDAFTWLLFGKDANDRKDFDIKNTFDKSKNRQEHSVMGVIDINGVETTLKRVFKEKWQKKRGAEDSEMTGNTTDFFINEVPVSLAEYQRKINEICDEQTFKLITNPAYFNSLRWEQRREILFKIADCPTDSLILNSEAKFNELAKIVNTGKSLEEYKKEIASKKKNIKDVLDLIPARIDEVQKSLLPELDWIGIQTKISNRQIRMSEIDKTIENENKAFTDLISQNNTIYQSINKLTSELNKIESDIKNNASKQANDRQIEISNLTGQKNKINSDIVNLKNQIEQNEIRIKNGESEILKLREEWSIENEKSIKFNENEFVCPACKRQFETENIESKKAEMLKNFNSSKLNKLNEINERGVTYKKTIEDLDNKNKGFELIIADKTNELNSIVIPEPINVIEIDFKTDKTWIGKNKEIEAENLKIKTVPEANTSELKQQKINLQNEIADLNNELSTKQQIDKSKLRIDELKADEKRLSQELTTFEKSEYLIAEFTKFKIQSIESKINSMFTTCKFQLFNKLVNGGVEEACNCLVNDVDYNSNLNFSAKILAGLEICNIVGKFYEIQAPVFLDNYESITSEVKSDLQLILLIASNKYKNLHIE